MEDFTTDRLEMMSFVAGYKLDKVAEGNATMSADDEIALEEWRVITTRAWRARFTTTTKGWKNV